MIHNQACARSCSPAHLLLKLDRGCHRQQLGDNHQSHNLGGLHWSRSGSHQGSRWMRRSSWKLVVTWTNNPSRSYRSSSIIEPSGIISSKYVLQKRCQPGNGYLFGCCFFWIGLLVLDARRPHTTNVFEARGSTNARARRGQCFDDICE